MSANTGLDWDDLRFFLGVAANGTAKNTAQSLRVNQTTVSRRVASLEARLGTRLFNKSPAGFRLTGAGEKILGAAERMADEVAGIEASIAGEEAALSGTVRLAISEAILHTMGMPFMHTMLGKYPEIELELMASDTVSDLMRHEADVALRFTSAPQESLVGRKAATTAIHLYRRRDGYLHPSAAGTPVLVFAMQDPSNHLTNAKWFRDIYPDARTQFAFNSAPSIHEAVRSGLGLARLPCFMGDIDPVLERHPGSVSEKIFDIWILTHPDLRTTARVRAVTDILWDRLQAWRGVIEGDEPNAWKKFPELSMDRASGVFT
jgi:DNA-binding transcriptional LysR family regulator